jgi:rod shape-determining protein MreB
MAEQTKITIGTAYPPDEVRTMEVKGRDLIGGVPKTLEINNKEIYEALEEPVTQIVEAIRNALERTPPELAADIVDKGIVMAGGGSLLNGLDVRLREETELPIIISEECLTCVVKGAGMALNELKLLKQISLRE